MARIEQVSLRKEHFNAALEFLTSYELKTAVVDKRKRPFYKSLTTLVRAAMERDRDFETYLQTLPATEQRRLRWAKFLGYYQFEDPGKKLSYFGTTREGWTNLDIAPSIWGHKTPYGSSITVRTTSDASSRFDSILLWDSGLRFARAWDNGRIEGGHSDMLARNELTAQERKSLIAIFQESTAVIQMNHDQLKSRYS